MDNKNKEIKSGDGSVAAANIQGNVNINNTYLKDTQETASQYVNQMGQTQLKRVILIVESNPKDTARLSQLNKEKRAIEKVLSKTDKLGYFIPIIKNAASFDDLVDAILIHEPEIIHFMGHGEGESGLCFEGADGKKQLLPNRSIKKIFELASSVKFVFLNACYSEVQAKIIIEHVDYVIGMSDRIPDPTALTFAEKIYNYIGLYKTIPVAFEWAKVVCEAHDLQDHLVPVLLTKNSTPVSDSGASTSAKFPPDPVTPKPPKPQPDPVVSTPQSTPVVQRTETLTPNSPLLLIPTSSEHQQLMADKHYREVEAEFESRWGIVNSRRVSTLSDLERELDMDMPNVVYVYTKIQNGKLVLDHSQHGDVLDLEDLASMFRRSGLRPLLILVLVGQFNSSMIPVKLREQTRFIWCLYGGESALDELSDTVRSFFERSSHAESDELDPLIKGLASRSAIRSECFCFEPLRLSVDAKSQRKEQQFRAAMLRIMLGRKEIKSELGLSIQDHLGQPSIFVYAVVGSELSCIFELPQQVYNKMLPNPKSNQGIVLVNWPLHVTITPEVCFDDWSAETSIHEVIKHNIKQGADDLGALVQQKAASYGISENAGAVVFHWNITLNDVLSEEQLNNWLTAWSKLVAEKFGDIYTHGVTLVHALCIKVKDRAQIQTVHDQVQGFISREIEETPSFTPYPIRAPLSNLEPFDIEGFFRDKANADWIEYFRFKDFTIDRVDLARWVCDKTGGEFEEVVRSLWQIQQTNYREYL